MRFLHSAGGLVAHPRNSRTRHAGRRGSVAVEFAIISLVFLTMALGTMEVGYDYFVQAALDTAVQSAARAVQTGSAVRTANQSLANFLQQTICPGLGPLLTCSNLYVSVVAIPSGNGQNFATYIASNPPALSALTSSSDVICTGTAGQLMLIRAYYLSPTFVGLLAPSFSVISPVDSTRVHASFASAGFVNEYFSGGEAGC